MWIARVADSTLPFGTKAVLMLLAFEFDAYGTPLYASKQELIERLKAKCPDLKDTYIEKGGWATFPGMAAPDRGVAQACANLLTAL